ncbi:monovalent cation/H+ antiporter subunit D family protein [Aliikangiella marina]|uniref:Monovalent cation/H+ antiporter subunit D family protein n=1 Tax=Aliikangiella marina TaxID=1712262 RepID=A0A545TCJ3_9GAMM|nr:monovalent cation/H+ antiporter subunit D family protein [Aliikangiella marina]TQV74929.1 monovalent cation/H+ antiporter subunit D family protein [Aliikangiella marina]
MNPTEHLAALQVVVPFLAAPLIVLLKAKRLAWAATTLTSLLTFCIAIALTMGVLDGQNYQYFMGSWPAPYGIELKVDAFSAVVLLIITGASTSALIAGYHSLDKQIGAKRQPMFFAAWILALAGLAGIVVSADAFNIFVFMEISSLASYVLVAGGPDRRALPAVFKYLIFGTIGATFYLIGVGLIYMMTGTLNIEDMGVRIADVADQSPVLVAAGFITVGLALKAALFPLHIWLPNAYTFAPHIVTVFLAACATKVSLYVLFRFDFFVFQENLGGQQLHFTFFFLPLSVFAILIASAVALFERNLKRLLAWSSVAQIGYIVLGASLVSIAGLTASVLHVFNHAIAKGSLFLAVACLACHIKRLRLTDIAGCAKAMPWTMGAMVLAGLSLIGVPGTAGFISKWYLISAVLELGGATGVFLTAVIVLGSLMAVIYVWRIVEYAYFKPQGKKPAVSEAPFGILAITWIVAIGNLYFGINPELAVTLSESAASVLMGHNK